MARFRGVLLATGLALALAGCQQANDAAFDAKVRAYLLAHPEVIEEAYAKLQANRQAQAAVDAKKAIIANRAALVSDPRDFVANPQGKVTVVEFFDYRCPYCKAALPALMDLIRKDRDVRFVFKEFPVLDNEGTPGVSRRAALAAIAAKPSGRYLELHNAMMGTKALDDAGIGRALAANGLDPLIPVKDAPAADKQIADTLNLGMTIGLTGTPSFIVGDKLISGADMDALAAAIAEAKKAKG